MSVIKAGTTLTTAYTVEADTNGDLVLQTNGTTTAVTIDTSQNVGIGTGSPSSKLDVSVAANTDAITVSNALGRNLIIGSASDGTFDDATAVFNKNSSVGRFLFKNAGGDRMLLDSSGNLGLGVTPSAWVSGDTILQVKAGSSTTALWGRSSTGRLITNAYYDGSNYRYIASTSATSFEMNVNSGAYTWNTASSGTAGDPITFTQAMTLDANGNLGVGTTTPGLRLHVTGSNGFLAQFLNSTNNSGEGVALGSGSGVGRISSNGASTALTLETNGTERARIASNGFVHVDPAGSYSAIGAFPSLSAQSYHTIQANVNDRTLAVLNANTGGTAGAISTQVLTGASYQLQGFLDSNVVFLVAANGDVTNTNNSYGQISDIKTKQDVVDAASQWDDIKGLRVRKFRFKADPSGPLQIGVVAQELEQISPGLVSESPDYEEVEVTDEEGNVTKERQPTGTVTKSVKYSVLYMKAIKALQEAMTRIEQLESEVAALKGAG